MSFLVTYLVSLVVSFSYGDTKETPSQTKKLNTQVNFEDLLVQGKYHFSDEAVTTVEQDKVLTGLLSVRKDFKDRIEKSKEQY